MATVKGGEGGTWSHVSLGAEIKCDWGFQTADQLRELFCTRFSVKVTFDLLASLALSGK